MSKYRRHSIPQVPELSCCLLITRHAPRLGRGPSIAGWTAHATAQSIEAREPESLDHGRRVRPWGAGQQPYEASEDGDERISRRSIVEAACRVGGEQWPDIRQEVSPLESLANILSSA
jgi:hypothetical protein